MVERRRVDADGVQDQVHDLHERLRLKRERSAAYRAANPEKIKAYRKQHYDLHRHDARYYDPAERQATHLRRKFNMTPEDYERLLVAQAGGCAVCGGTNSDRRLHVDHDHDTGEVRGLLCFTCNSAIGKFEDDPALLRRAIAYLER